MKKKIIERIGYTLIELIIVMLILGILAGVSIPTIGNLVTKSKIEASKKEMNALVKAIAGDSELGILGYLDEVGSLPTSLNNLCSVTGLSPYNPFTRTGWNGPYIDMSQKDIDGVDQGSDGLLADDVDMLYDAWGRAYKYDNTNGNITSDGPNMTTGDGDDITVQLK